MNSSCTRRFILTLAALSPVYAASAGFAASAPQQPQLSLSRDAALETVALLWFAKSGSTYQLQKSTDLVVWTDEGAAVPGANNFTSATLSTAGVPQAFFRLKPDLITAFFSGGVLIVNGGDMDNEIILSRDEEGYLLIDGVRVNAAGGIPKIGNTIRVDIFGRGGDDQLVLDESMGALPPVRLFGEAGKDLLSGGSSGDLLDGGADNDTLFGRGGDDTLLGGDGDDALTGGDGEDQVSGDNDNDRLFWNAGDDTDLNEGGFGTDTVEVNGGEAGENFTATANGTRVRFDQLTPEPCFLDMGTTEKLLVNTHGGNDRFSATGNLAALIQIHVDGGAGEDILLGSNGADTLLGGEDNDFIDGNQGSDMILMGGGDDVAQWDPGDLSDLIEGQGGSDTLRFHGSNGSELITVSGNGTRVSLVRNLGNIAMDLNEIETLDIRAFGAADTVTVNNLVGTGVKDVIADLAASGGGGDGAMDNVVIQGTGADDVISAELTDGSLAVNGLAARVLVKGYQPASDAVRIAASSGEDVIDASAVATGGPRLVLVGDAGEDILLGSADVDTLDGGDQEDILFGGGGVDVLDGGFEYGNILIQEGLSHVTGIVTVFGNNSDDTITISRNEAGEILSNGEPIAGATVANTSLIRVFGREGNDTITMDETAGALPPVALYGGAGNDTLSGTSSADLIFGGSGTDTLLGNGGQDQVFGGSGDDELTGGAGNDKLYGGADADHTIWNPGDETDIAEGGSGIDTVEVNGTDEADLFTPAENGTRVFFDGLAPSYFFISMGDTEHLQVNAKGGDDDLALIGNLAGLIQVTVDGGAGDDQITGSDGEDTFIGGDGEDVIDGKGGNDTILGGNDNDVLKWVHGGGNDVIEGQDGTDTLLFTGNEVGEVCELSANGPRVQFKRNVASTTQDVAGIEIFDLKLLGSADTLKVNDLTDTGVAMVIADLAGPNGMIDGIWDNLILSGTPAADAVSLTSSGTDVIVTGLPATVRILKSEAALDDVLINGLGGTDTFSVAPGVHNLIRVTTIQ